VPINRNHRFVGSVVSEIDLSHVDQLLKSFMTLREMEITLLDRQERVITSTRLDVPALIPFKQHQGGEIRPLNDKVYQWLPLGKMPIMMRWKKSFYVQKTSAGEKLPFELIVALPTQPHFIYLENLYIKSLSILLLITALALALANAISRWLAQPILQLAEVTTDLPDKLLDQQAIHWPKSWDNGNERSRLQLSIYGWLAGAKISGNQHGEGTTRTPSPRTYTGTINRKSRIRN
jgi:hypothetical protein